MQDSFKSNFICFGALILFLMTIPFSIASAQEHTGKGRVNGTVADDQGAERPTPAAPDRGRSLTARFLLWVFAVGLMFAAVVYQRATGPSHPYRGSFRVAGETFDYALIRTHVTTSDAVVALPDPGPEVSGTLSWRRYPLDEPFTTEPLRREIGSLGPMERESVAKKLGGKLFAPLPRQPAAGKLEYYLVLDTPNGSIRSVSFCRALHRQCLPFWEYRDPAWPEIRRFSQCWLQDFLQYPRNERREHPCPVSRRSSS